MRQLTLLLIGLVLSCSTQAQNRMGGGDMLVQMDSDADGSITKQEFLAGREQMFTKRDRNADGYLDSEDMGQRAARGGERMKQVRDRLDTDGDGKISKNEFVSADTPLFTSADKDSNGTLNPDEIAAAKHAIQSRANERRNR